MTDHQTLVWHRKFGPERDGAPRFVVYLRVSTERQGQTRLGLQAQRESVARHLAMTGGQVLEEFEEVESGRRNDRPQLAMAMASCRRQKATLLIAKLDRLTRNVRFLLEVVEGAGEAGVAFCDLPALPPGPVGKFMLTQMAAVAELEAGLISQRTRAALAVAKARGVRLGNPQLRPGTAETARHAAQARSRQASLRAAEIWPYLEEGRQAGATSLQAQAQALNARGIPTPTGRGLWSATQVRRIQLLREEALRR